MLSCACPPLVSLRLITLQQAFGVDDLAKYLYGQHRLEMMDRIGAIVQAEPAFDKSQQHYLGRMGKFEMAVKKVSGLATTSAHG